MQPKALLKLLALIPLLSLLCLQPLSIKAQSGGGTTGSIIGSVKDEQGALISNAVITVKNLETNRQYTCNSNTEGNYQLFQLRPGNYQIKVEAGGFNSEILTVRLLLGVISFNNIVLSVDQTKDIIEVVANSVVDTQTKTESSTNITAERIENLPINQRNFLDFAVTAAHVTPDRLPPQGHGNTSGLSFNGQSPRQNIINVDGHDNNDYTSGTVRATFSQEAVQEYQIISDGYSAEFGRALGGVINIITKSGSNDFHGSNFFFYRNDSTSARNPFVSKKPPFDQYQFGASISGPILKDRLFFFGAFERLTVKQSNVVTVSNATIQAINNTLLPTKNGAIPVAVGTTSGLARIDYIRPNNSTYIRFNSSGRYNGTYEPFGGLVTENNGGVLRLTENSIAINNIHNSNDGSRINETRFLYNNRDLLIQALSEGPQVLVVAPEGMVATGRSIVVPQITKSNLFQFSNITSLIKEKHQIKFGGDLIYMSNRSRFTVTGDGIAIFAPVDFSGFGFTSGAQFSALEALDPSLRTPQQRVVLSQLSQIFPNVLSGFPQLPLADLSFPVFYQQGFPGKDLVPTKPRLVSLFVQDDYKATNRLLLKAGLRYDYSGSTFVPDNNGNVAPRVAFSYNPSFNQNMRIHGAYGFFFAANSAGDIEIVVTPNSPPNFFMPFPFSVQAFMQPTRKFNSVSEIPANVPQVPQFSVIPEFQPDLRASYTQQANFGIDYVIKNRFKVVVDYTYVRGLKLLRSRDINPIVRPVPNNPIASFINGRLEPNRGSRVYLETAADSYFHSFTATVAGQIINGINILSHYTFSKGIDNLLDYNPTIPGINPIDPLNPGLERSLSLQDVRNRFVLSGDVELGRINRLLSKTSLSTIVTLESGRPYNLLVGADLDMNGDFPPSDRPMNISRNAGITPGFANVDMRLTRTIPLGETVKLNFTIEAFNLFNRVNINNIDFTFPPDANGNFNLPKQKNGRYTVPPDRFRNAFGSRQLQFGFKLLF